jgi:hypothetical protein
MDKRNQYGQKIEPKLMQIIKKLFHKSKTHIQINFDNYQ